MPQPEVESLPYRGDSAALFSHIAAEPWAVFLDSCAGTPAGGRFDILAAGPRITLHTRGAVTEVRDVNGIRISRDDPLDLLRNALGDPLPARSGLPFQGGAIGWLGYDLARRFESLGLRSPLPGQLPQMAMGIYDWALVTDHREQTTCLIGRGSPDDPRRLRLRRAALATDAPEPGPFAVRGPLSSNMDERAYAVRFEQVQRYIRNGDCYQVNLARRWSVPAAGDPWRVYCRLRSLSPAPFSAFLNTPPVVVLSASPERFLRVTDGYAETRPIKGTARRDVDPATDAALARGLAQSLKDRAENLMIVDLLRNDLGRCCRVGSVRVPGLFEVESYPGVHHLVSTVTGRLRADQDALSLLRACFPGGSITGAPKIRAMQIIDELEQEPRGVYCGAIGYLGFDGAMDSNIAIRTLTLAHDELAFHAGGGVVADSRAEAEWGEIGLKARAMLALVRHFSMTSETALHGAGEG